MFQKHPLSAAAGFEETSFCSCLMILTQQFWVFFTGQIHLLVDQELVFKNPHYFILMKLFQMCKLLINANVHSHQTGRILQTSVKTGEPLLIFTFETFLIPSLLADQLTVIYFYTKCSSHLFFNAYHLSLQYPIKMSFF